VTACEIISELDRRGVALTVRDGRLIAKPVSAVPPEIKTIVHSLREELIGILTHPTDPEEMAGGSAPEAELSTEHSDEAARIVRLDAERREADRIARRGYDFDSSAPSHAEFLRREAQRRALEQQGKAGFSSGGPI
jgi:hypothetical protein